jgi:hypothetical protein
MKFYQALELIVEQGQKVRHESWAPGRYACLRDGEVMMFSNNVPFCQLSEMNLNSEGWEVFKETRKFKKSLWFNLYSDGGIGGPYSKKEYAIESRSCRNSEQRELVIEWEADNELP